MKISYMHIYCIAVKFDLLMNIVLNRLFFLFKHFFFIAKNIQI